MASKSLIIIFILNIFSHGTHLSVIIFIGNIEDALNNAKNINQSTAIKVPSGKFKSSPIIIIFISHICNLLAFFVFANSINLHIDTIAVFVSLRKIITINQVIIHIGFDIDRFNTSIIKSFNERLVRLFTQGLEFITQRIVVHNSFHNA